MNPESIIILADLLDMQKELVYKVVITLLLLFYGCRFLFSLVFHSRCRGRSAFVPVCAMQGRNDACHEAVFTQKHHTVFITH